MATLIEDFNANFISMLNSITTSSLYTDIKQMYLDGVLQKDQYDKIIIAFHEKALQVAGSNAVSISEKGYRVDEIIDKDLMVQQNKIDIALREIAEREAQGDKDLLVKQNQIDVNSGELGIKMNESANRISVANSELALKTTQSGKDAVLKDKQADVEAQRKLLLVSQTQGFDDNVKIEFNKSMNESIGMIESGGNEAPASLWNAWSTSVNLVQSAASR